MNNTQHITPTFNSIQNVFCSDHETPAAVHLIVYLKKLKLQKIFSMVTDPRKGKVLYSLHTLLMTALANVLFRMGSKYAFHQEGRRSKASEAALAKFAGITSGQLPDSKTIDDVLNRLDYEEMNEVLMNLFELRRKNKFFKRYPQLLPRGLFHLAIDAEVTHKYTPSSAHNYERCPHCLKREREKVTWYLHVQVTVSIVCPGNIRMPLYVYPIHAKALHQESPLSDEKFKQECEFSAFPVVLKKIRERFPRLHFCVLTDSLYANGPAMKTIKQHRMEFMIVRKKGSMKTVGEDCDGIAKTLEHEKNCRLEKIEIEHRVKKKRSWSFFNEVEYQDTKLNILRFDEWILDKEGKESEHVHWEWIVSWKLTKRNIGATTVQGRMRWLEEDLFNTVKNRGFEIKHDYSRNWNSQIIWSILIMMSFLITELFSLVRSVVAGRKNRSLRDFMRSIFGELCIHGKEIFSSPILSRNVQIRYCLLC